VKEDLDELAAELRWIEDLANGAVDKVGWPYKGTLEGEVEKVRNHVEVARRVVVRLVEASIDAAAKAKAVETSALARVEEAGSALADRETALAKREAEADFLGRRLQVELAAAKDLDARASAVLRQLGDGNRRRDAHESAHNLLRSKLFGFARQLGASIAGSGPEDGHVAAQFLFDRAKAAEARPAHEDPVEVDRSARLGALAQLEAALAAAADDPRPVADLVARWKRELGVEQPPLAVVIEGRCP
jgi:hypothetical protein